MNLPNKMQVETIKMASRILSSIIFNTTSIHPEKLAGSVTNKIGRLKRDTLRRLSHTACFEFKFSKVFSLK